ncbi:DeoR/GlpR family DNA-binding transcription regulator [Ancylobacter mangrovi]|nr:DeoR/GlpR family DNA-binding transcription regulator [Ancylobacter mangrovi]
MIPAERQHFIIDRLDEMGVLSIAALSEVLGVSQMTVRRDIEQLERAGRVMSVTGGVQLPERILSEPSHTIKGQMHRAEKVAIGRLAASMVKSNDVIYLDAGTTTLEIAKRLLNLPDITVVTNDFTICSTLAAAAHCQLCHTGGRVDRENQSCIGNRAADMVKQFNFDIAFISTSSWGMRGISTPSEDKIAVKTSAVECAVRSVLVTDSSKYGKLAAYHSLPLRAFTTIISDSGLAETVCQGIREQGIELLVA